MKKTADEFIQKFLSTPSVRRATIHNLSRAIGNMISIHALREEGDGRCGRFRSVHCKISIHALREEGDGQMQGKNPQEMIFLSTPSVRRATICCGSPPA